MVEKLFKLKENNTTVKTEILAGVTTFMTMAYILAVNPSILSAAGMDQGAVFTATVLASFLGTVCMALFANYPFALAPGMGLNAYFAYTVVLGMGYPWQAALAAVFVEGVIFILLSMFNIREAIFNSIPTNLKKAVSVGIGFFIAFIGLQNAKIVVGGATLVELFSLSAVEGGTMQDVGITVILAIVGVLITSILVIKQVKGNILWGILITWILGIICQFAGIYVPNPEIGFYGLLPDFSSGLSIPSIAPIFAKFDFAAIPFGEFVVIIFAFLFVDMFDTLGTLIGVASKADMLDNHRALNDLYHELDPTRLTTLACYAMCGPFNRSAHITDLVSWNLYLGWYVPGLFLNDLWMGFFHLRYPKRPLGYSEYGCEAMPNLHSSRPRRGDHTEEYQCVYNEYMLECFAKHPYLWATHLWNMFDFAADARDQGGEPGMNHKGIVTFDRQTKKDSFYLYKAWWSGEPFVHICGRRYADRPEAVTTVKVYSNQSKVTLYADGKLLEEKTGDKVFTFRVPLEGQVELKAVSGDCEDSCVIRHVDTPNPAYKLQGKSSNSANWV